MTSSSEAAAPEVTGSDRLRQATRHFDEALTKLANGTRLAEGLCQNEVLQAAEALMELDGGLAALFERAPRFEASGVFAGGPWEDASRLQPPLVIGSLQAAGVHPIVETLSELRVLAIATGAATGLTQTADEALVFLREVLALNLELLLPHETEAARGEHPKARRRNERLFHLIVEHISFENIQSALVSEIDQLAAQRPIVTTRLEERTRFATRLPTDHIAASERDRLQVFQRAIEGPSALSRKHGKAAAYRRALREADREVVRREALDLATSLKQTGLASPHHAVLLQHLRRLDPEQISVALGLNDLGGAELAQSREQVHELIRVAIFPATRHAIYGLARTLERGLLSRPEVAAGLRCLVDLDLQPDVKKLLLAGRQRGDGGAANGLLVAGALSVLGQPLGVGRGELPSCQAARGISLWAQRAPGHLLEIVASAAREGRVQVRFEGEVLRSDQLRSGLVADTDSGLDTVSQVLVPHLDRLYNEILRRVADRPEDGHKWANPGLYGRWVPHGFASVFDKRTGAVTGYDDFVRRFYATHHPAYNDGRELVYPNPAGVLVTDAHADLVGLHAVSLQRIREDPEGRLRVYFYDPNHEGRQDWGHGVVTSVFGHGELEGESSLRFDQLCARLYAFHFNPSEGGDTFAVPDETVSEVEASARKSWGKEYRWV